MTVTLIYVDSFEYILAQNIDLDEKDMTADRQAQIAMAYVPWHVEIF